MNEKLLVPAVEAAKMLSIGRSTFWNKVKLKQLPQPVKFGGVTRWRVSDLRAIVDARSDPESAI
jgi:predicted DNA-binding transcriptional regulator AlpA